jgi:DNA polymerase
MDDLDWLRLQLEWGADEALLDVPVDRRLARPAPPAAPFAPPRMPIPAALPSTASAAARAQAAADAASTPEDLKAALAAFDGCALRTTATNLVFRDGAGGSGLVLIADVPGAAEDRTGLPFAGAAAALLDRMFASAGLDRAAALSTSLIPWRPPGGRQPTEAEIQLCLPFLLRHLALVRPRHAVVFGAIAARSLLPGTGRRARGVWHELAVPGLPNRIPTLAIPSPAHIQATPAAKRDAWADLLRLRRAILG